MTVKELFKKADPTVIFYAYIMLEPVYDEYKEYDVQTKAEGLEELKNKLLDNIQLIVNAKDNINEVESGTIFVMERKSTEYDRPFESYTEAFLVKDEEAFDKVDKDFTIWNDKGECRIEHYAFDFESLQTIANYKIAEESVRHMGIEACCAAILNEVCFWGLIESIRNATIEELKESIEEAISDNEHTRKYEFDNVADLMADLEDDLELTDTEKEYRKYYQEYKNKVRNIEKAYADKVSNEDHMRYILAVKNEYLGRKNNGKKVI